MKKRNKKLLFGSRVTLSPREYNSRLVVSKKSQFLSSFHSDPYLSHMCLQRKSLRYFDWDQRQSRWRLESWVMDGRMRFIQDKRSEKEDRIHVSIFSNLRDKQILHSIQAQCQVCPLVVLKGWACLPLHQPWLLFPFLPTWLQVHLIKSMEMSRHLLHLSIKSLPFYPGISSLDQPLTCPTTTTKVQQL